MTPHEQLIEQDMADRCGQCRRTFDSDVPSGFVDLGRYRNTAFCNGCVSRCHESTYVDHECDICR